MNNLIISIDGPAGSGKGTIAKYIAKKYKAYAVSHGSTGKGNDQVRFELGAYALNPDIKVIAPWREWNLNSRKKLLAYAEDKKIPIEGKKKTGSPYSMDANLLHISYEGGQLEDPWCAPEESMWRWTIAPEDAPDSGESIELEFEKGDPIALNGKKLSYNNYFDIIQHNSTIIFV